MAVQGLPRKLAALIWEAHRVSPQETLATGPSLELKVPKKLLLHKPEHGPSHPFPPGLLLGNPKGGQDQASRAH